MPDESIQIPIEIKPVKGFEDLAKVSTVVSKAVSLIESTVEQATGSIGGMGGAAAKSASLMQSAFTNSLKPIQQLEAELGELEAAIRRSTNLTDIKRFNDQISALNRQISNMKVVGFESSMHKIGESANRAGQQLNRLPGAANPAVYSLTNMGRVLQDLPYGMIGVANNITPLIESMVQLSANAKATGVSMGKQLLSSITGGGGLIFGFSILTSVMQFATLGLSAFSRGAGSAKSKTAEIKEEVWDFGKTIDEVAGELSKSASKVTQLFAALNSGKLNFDERKAALKDLASVNKEFFGSLKEEDGLIKGLQSAYDGYILRLKEIGKTKAIESQLTKLFDKKLQLELAIDPKFANATDPLLQKQLGKLKAELKSLGGAVDFTKEKFDISMIVPETKVDTATKKVANLTNVLENVPEWGKKLDKDSGGLSNVNGKLAARIGLMQRISQLEREGFAGITGDAFQGASKEINDLDLQISALSDLLTKTGNFEIPVPDGKDANKVMDETIARARMFVKEYGEIFVVPDLEETFFKGKLQVFQEAADLLKNIEIKNLKIKLPKADFETTDGLVPFTPEVDPNFKFDEDGKLRAAFLEQLKAEFQEPFVIDPTINIAAFNDKIKTQLGKALSAGDFKGALDLIDTDKTNAVFDGLDERTKQSALLMESTLTPAFQELLDAITNGENPLKAFFNSIIQSVNQVIKRLIAAAVQAAILAAVSGGTTTFGSAFQRLFGGGGGAANFGSRVAFAGGGAGAANISVTGILRGPDIYLSGLQGAASVGRAGG